MRPLRLWSAVATRVCITYSPILSQPPFGVRFAHSYILSQPQRRVSSAPPTYSRESVWREPRVCARTLVTLGRCAKRTPCILFLLSRPPRLIPPAQMAALLHEPVATPPIVPASRGRRRRHRLCRQRLLAMALTPSALPLPLPSPPSPTVPLTTATTVAAAASGIGGVIIIACYRRRRQ